MTYLVLETFPAVLTHEIARSGQRLDHLQEHLSTRGATVTLTTLSHWRRGQVRPDLDTSGPDIALLEELLDLPTGRLAALLMPRKR